MLSFGFTKKKLLSLSCQNRHRHIIIWLSKFYHKMACNRISPKELEWFQNQYNTIRGWMDIPLADFPDDDDIRRNLEIVSDRIHDHRLAAGLTVREPDLLEKPLTRIPENRKLNIDMDCHVALDGLRSAFNVGSVFRTCEATGISSIILSNTPGKENRQVQKTAMGCHDRVHQETADDLCDALILKKKKGYRIIGVETMATAIPFNRMTWPEKTILVFGNEEYGISSHTLGACDAFVYLPMAGKKNSINVANAVSVICFSVMCSFIG